jgi:hypothetical protein
LIGLERDAKKWIPVFRETIPPNDAPGANASGSASKHHDLGRLRNRSNILELVTLVLFDPFWPETAAI